MPVPLRVLIVEDSEDDALLLVETLRAGGFEPLAQRVDTPGEMRAALDTRLWDLVIADYNLPQFSAPAALQALRETGLDLPFIVVSGQVGEETAAAVMKAGAHDYLMKGSLARLVPAIRRELDEAQDRRERRRAEEALRQSERKYRQLVENLREGIWVIDRDAHTTFANRTMAQMLGYTVAEMQGRHLFSFIDPQAVELAKRNLRRRELGIAERLEFEFLRKDGARIYASLDTSPILSPEGAYLGAMASVMDVTERHRAEMALQASEQRFRTLFECASDAIFIHDLEGHFLEVNRVACERLGYSRDELLGMTPMDIDTPETAGLVRERIEALRRVGYQSFETVHVRRDGRTIPTEISSRLIDLEGQAAVLSIARDISERKRLEREVLRASEEEQRRIGRELHDGLGQALTGIAFMVHALATKLAAAGSPEAPEAATITQLVTQATDLARSLAQGLSPLGIRANDIVSALEDLAARTVQIHRVSCTLDCDAPATVPDGVAATNLYRIAQEAVTNAVKHGSPRQIRIALTQHDGCVRLTVENDGADFPDGAEPAQGMGIRLMRYRANAIGALLDVRRGEQGGTRVACSLPRARLREPNAASGAQ